MRCMPQRRKKAKTSHPSSKPPTMKEIIEENAVLRKEIEVIRTALIEKKGSIVLESEDNKCEYCVVCDCILSGEPKSGDGPGRSSNNEHDDGVESKTKESVDQAENRNRGCKRDASDVASSRERGGEEDDLQQHPEKKIKTGEKTENKAMFSMGTTDQKEYVQAIKDRLRSLRDASALKADPDTPSVSDTFKQFVLNGGMTHDDGDLNRAVNIALDSKAAPQAGVAVTARAGSAEPTQGSSTDSNLPVRPISS